MYIEKSYRGVLRNPDIGKNRGPLVADKQQEKCCNAHFIMFIMYGKVPTSSCIDSHCTKVLSLCSRETGFIACTEIFGSYIHE